MAIRDISDEDVSILLKNIKNEKLKLAILISYLDGLRIGEICNLKLENLEFDHNLYRLEKQKNGFLRGSRYMSEAAKRAILDYIRKYGKDIVSHDNYLIFSQKSAKNIDSHNLGQMFRKCVGRLIGFKKYIGKSRMMNRNCFHALRARSITNNMKKMLLSDGSVSERELMLHSGHLHRNSLDHYLIMSDEMVIYAGRKREFINRFRTISHS